MRLFGYGCSFTYGQSLEGPRHEGDIIGEISNDSWPMVLGRLIGIQGINRGECAASNKQILYQFLSDVKEFDITSDDIVVFMWSFDHRFGFLLEEYPDRLWNRMNPENPKCNDFYLNYSTTKHDAKYEFFRACNHAHLYCEHLGIRNIHSAVEHTMVENPPDWNLVDFGNIETENMKHIKRKHPYALDGNHPGILAHKEFAELCVLRI